MNIVVATRCLNESKNVERFLKGYEFADHIVVSEGGSTDDSVSKLQQDKRVHISPFEEYEIHDGHRWNPDNNHIQHAIDLAMPFNPDWVILDDLDDVPNFILRLSARTLLEHCHYHQVNVFRLYMWGDDQFFPQMNDNFNPDYTSIWAWKPKKIDVHTDKSVRHGTLLGLSDNPLQLELPSCLLHKSWHPDTIDEKIKRYNAIGLPMNHPLEFAGTSEKLPEWAHE